MPHSRRPGVYYRGKKVSQRVRQARIRASNRRSRRGLKPKMARVALGLKQTKIKHINSTAGTNLWNNTNKWVSFQPLNLDLSSVNTDIDREGNMVYAMNYRLKLHLETHPDYTNPYYLRILQGWAKGSNAYGESQSFTQPSQMVTSSTLNSLLPNHFSDLDNKDWKMLQDRVIRITPRQIYDSTSGDSTAENTGVSNHNQGLWGPVRKTFNFKFNRKFTYESVQGNSLVGWVPFCAIMLDRTPYGTAFTGNGGSGPSPLLTYESDLYFKDIS